MRKPYSKLRNRIKKTATNEFSALTGLPAIQLTGNCDCLVTAQKTFLDMPVKKYAYLAYNGLVSADPDRINPIRVTNTCGVDQCVHKDHLKAYDPYANLAPSQIFLKR